MANRKIGQAGLNLIKQFEGCRLSAYQCAAGVWTIGYGHTAGVKKGMTIMQAQADAYLKQDIIIVPHMCQSPQISIRISLTRWYRLHLIVELATLKSFVQVETHHRLL